MPRPYRGAGPALAAYEGFAEKTEDRLAANVRMTREAYLMREREASLWKARVKLAADSLPAVGLVGILASFARSGNGIAAALLAVVVVGYVWFVVATTRGWSRRRADDWERRYWGFKSPVTVESTTAAAERVEDGVDGRVEGGSCP